MQNFVVSKKIEVQIAKMSYFGFFCITGKRAGRNTKEATERRTTFLFLPPWLLSFVYYSRGSLMLRPAVLVLLHEFLAILYYDALVGVACLLACEVVRYRVC